MPISSTMLMLGYDFSWHLILGKPWTRDALSMMFVLALYLPWCRYLASQQEVEPQLHADDPEYVSGDPLGLLRAAELVHWLCPIRRSGACSLRVSPCEHF